MCRFEVLPFASNLIIIIYSCGQTMQQQPYETTINYYIQLLMKFKYRYSIDRIIFVALTVLYGVYNKQCALNCQACDGQSAFCGACRSGYELSIVGKCIESSVVPGCQLFGPRNTCLVCKPTFRLINNLCVVMYDGCLISGPGGSCTKCLTGAYRSQDNTCDTKYLNCEKIQENGQCTSCQVGYTIRKGKCFNSQSECPRFQQQSGLCLSCTQGMILHLYQCIPQKSLKTNCYIMSPNGKQCSYCKNGYEVYYGDCYPPSTIRLMLTGNQAEAARCSDGFFYNISSKGCNTQPELCQKFDYGYLKCTFCRSNNILIEGTCKQPSLRFCQIFKNDNSKACQQCHRKFYVTKDGLCQPFPPFCEQVLDERCLKCISLFLLNSKGFCQDPNCLQFNAQSSHCQICKYSYIKNTTTDICTFKDLNCLKEDPNGGCLLCKTNYVLDVNKNICKFVDPDCKIFTEKEVCLQCKQGYYLNTVTNLCMELPYKCLSADVAGKCMYCAEGYALLTSYQCVRISNITNCLVQSQVDRNSCQICKDNFYRNSQGQCKQLPILCAQFNLLARKCTRCKSEGKLLNGLCFDKYCLILTDTAQCLGCLSGYQFSHEGNCVPEQTDSNCKQFVYGQCRKCSDRYYFNKLWQCVSVEALCKNYDPNNGACTSCYPGYILRSGACVRQHEQSACQQFATDGQSCLKCLTGYLLSQGRCQISASGKCVTLNQNKTCVKCSQAFMLDANTGLCVTITSSKYQLQNCLEYSPDLKVCTKCVNRMYYNITINQCMPINENCKMYANNGECLQCYAGYQSAIDRTKCIVSQSSDAHCKISLGDGCKECYPGYYYSQVDNACLELDTLCQTSDVANGNCLSCWRGYKLQAGHCSMVDASINISTGTIEQGTIEQMCEVVQLQKCIKCVQGYQLREGQCEQIKSQPDLQCRQYEHNDTKKCATCVIGAAYDQALKNCEYPLYGLDINCMEYRYKLCVQCHSLHLLVAYLCVPMDPDCLIYDLQVPKCITCKDNMQPDILRCVQAN